MFDLSGSYFFGLPHDISDPSYKPNRITGVGRMKLRGPDKQELYHHKKKKKASRTAKKSRRINRR